MLIMDNDELYMELDSSYYYKVRGLKYLIFREGKITNTNCVSYKDLDLEVKQK